MQQTETLLHCGEPLLGRGKNEFETPDLRLDRETLLLRTVFVRGGTSKLSDIALNGDDGPLGLTLPFLEIEVPRCHSTLLVSDLHGGEFTWDWLAEIWVTPTQFTVFETTEEASFGVCHISMRVLWCVA